MGDSSGERTCQKKEDFVARIAVGNAQGPQSAVFRIWSPKGGSDIYAAVRDIAGEIKISLHESGKCSAGLTTQFALKESEAVNDMGGSRHQSQWLRLTNVGSKIVTPLQFVVPSSELTKWKNKSTDSVTWIEPPGLGRSLIISCIFSGQSISDDAWPGRKNGTFFLAPSYFQTEKNSGSFGRNVPLVRSNIKYCQRQRATLSIKEGYASLQPMRPHRNFDI